MVAGPVVKKLTEKGVTYYHACYETKDFDGDVERITNAGGIVAAEARSAVLTGGRRVGFIQVSPGLIDLLET